MDWVIVSWPTLILLAISLRMALRLHYGARGPDAKDPIYDFLTILCWVLMLMGMLPVFLGTTITLFGLVFMILAAITIVEIVTQRRTAQRRSICALLALLIERRQQVGTSYLSSARSMRGSVGRAAKKLFDSLNTGTLLVDAVRENSRALPQDAIVFVDAGAAVGAEASALRELSQASQSEMTMLWRASIDRISYLSCVLFVMCGVVAFLMIKIVPAYRDIFAEFEIELPRPTEAVVWASNIFVGYIAIPAILLLLIFAVASFVVGACYLVDIPILRGIVDRIFFSRRVPELMRVLAIAADGRRSIAGALERLAAVHPSPVIRKRLRPPAVAALGGNEWHEALCDAGIINRRETSLLKSAEKTGNLGWALRQLARRREKRTAYKLSTVLTVVYPFLILLLGSVVGFLVVSLFLPLVKLIESLT